MKALILTVLSVSLTTSLLANQVSESQQQYVKQYEKQENIPNPADMLINTDPEPELDAGFTSLYNGQNLDGWVSLGGTCTLEPKEEVIVGTCIPGSPSTYLSTVKNDYMDFIFTAELKWEVDGNSGVMFRSQAKKQKNGETAVGPQAEMEGFAKDRGWSGGIYGQGCGGWFYPLWLDAHAEARKALKKDDWNRITIKAEGDTVKTWINGVPAAHWKNDEYMKGFFSLQIHAGKEGTVLFRNIKVKELH